jgi:hypothetical protein
MDVAKATNAHKPWGAVLTKPPEAAAASLLAVLAVPDPGVSSQLLPTREAASIAADDAAGCATCTHLTQAGVCGEPVAAGLAARFEVFFCDTVPDGGVGCSAWTARPVGWRGSWGTLADRGAALAGDGAAGLVLCMVCEHWQPGRCQNYRTAGLAVSELAAGWHEQPQRCAGFKSVQKLKSRSVHAPATPDALKAVSGPVRDIREPAMARACPSDRHGLVDFTQEGQELLMAVARNANYCRDMTL